MTSSLENIPEDALFAIFSYLDIHDLASFQQVSRATYHRSNSDLLWHQLLPTFHLPISVPIGEAFSLSAPALRDLFNRASRIERQLQKHNPRLRELANEKIQTGSQWQALRIWRTCLQGWVLAFSISDTGVMSSFVAKRLNIANDATQGNTKPQPEILLHGPKETHASQIPFAVVTSRCSDYVVVTVRYHERVGHSMSTNLVIYSVTIQPSVMNICNNPSKLLGEIKILGGQYVHDMQCCGKITGISLKSLDISDPYQWFILLNNHTGDKIIYRIEEYSWRIYQEHFIIINDRRTHIDINIYPIPAHLKDHLHSPSNPVLPSELTASAPSSESFNILIELSAHAAINLPLPLERFRLACVDIALVLSGSSWGYKFSDISDSETGFSILTRIVELELAIDDIPMNTVPGGMPELMVTTHKYIQTITLPLYITAPYLAHSQATVKSSALVVNTTMLVQTASNASPGLLLHHQNDLHKPHREYLTQIGRKFWAIHDQGVIWVLTRSGSVTPSGRWNTHTSKEPRVVREIHHPGYVHVRDLDVFYDEHVGQICLTYQEQEDNAGRGDQRWLWRVHIWDIDTEYEA